MKELERLYGFARHLAKDPHVIITVEQEHDEVRSWWTLRCVAFVVGRGETLEQAIAACMADAVERVTKEMKETEARLRKLYALLQVGEGDEG